MTSWVTLVPSGRVTVVTPSVPVTVTVERPCASLTVRWTAPSSLRLTRYVVLRPSALVLTTVVVPAPTVRASVCAEPSAAVSLVRRPAPSYSKRWTPSRGSVSFVSSPPASYSIAIRSPPGPSARLRKPPAETASFVVCPYGATIAVGSPAPLRWIAVLLP